MASFESEEAALRAIAARIHRHGPNSIASLSLVRVDATTTMARCFTLASGAELVKIAPQFA